MTKISEQAKQPISQTMILLLLKSLLFQMVPLILYSNMRVLQLRHAALKIVHEDLWQISFSVTFFSIGKLEINTVLNRNAEESRMLDLIVYPAF